MSTLESQKISTMSQTMLMFIKARTSAIKVKTQAFLIKFFQSELWYSHSFHNPLLSVVDN